MLSIWTYYVYGVNYLDRFTKPLLCRLSYASPDFLTRSESSEPYQLFSKCVKLNALP